MSKLYDLFKLAGRFERKLAQQDPYSRNTPVVKKIISELVSFLQKTVDYLSNSEQGKTNYIPLNNLKGVISNLSQWLSLEKITKEEFYNVVELWDKGQSLLDENSKGYIEQQLKTLEDYLSPGF